MAADRADAEKYRRACEAKEAQQPRPGNGIMFFDRLVSMDVATDPVALGIIGEYQSNNEWADETMGGFFSFIGKALKGVVNLASNAAIGVSVIPSKGKASAPAPAPVATPAATPRQYPRGIFQRGNTTQGQPSAPPVIITQPSVPSYTAPSPGIGLNTNTMLIAGGVVLAAIVLTSKRGR